ncbi:hypothetical protein ACFCWG_24660 [Streptomyces sp. NPDC056390]|uniref:hypothetical protein n=1 Tax=Streptomyces sp. NPDC056390 TaxID=3345806 RepID=UPI0035DDB582
MQNMSREELVSLLDDMSKRVAAGDSFEGKLQYLLGADKEKPFEVAALYRIDNRLGQGSTRLVGIDVGPLGCPCGDTAGPFDLKTGRCDDCTEAAA